MQSQEQQLIENLFSRLKQAEGQSGPRDAAAEQLIKQHLQEQPGAPYYMSQAILIQEAALKKLNERISQLESQVTQLQQQQPQQSSGGFLSGLFGGGSRQQSQPAQQQSAWGNPAPQQQQYNAPQQQYNAPQQQYGAAPAPAPARGTGFLGGALQTAVGVAGGVVMADMLTSMFHHSQPEEIVNIINEPPLPEVDTSLDTFNGGDRNFLDQDNGWGNSFTDNTDFGNDSFDNDYDDDSFV